MLGDEEAPNDRVDVRKQDLVTIVLNIFSVDVEVGNILTEICSPVENENEKIT